MQPQIQPQYKNCVCLVIIGMAGTGKTTFVSRMNQQYSQQESSMASTVHSINLDPAVRVVPYKPFIDIRQTHEYKKVMKQYKLGPNGAILTALNLYLSQPENIVEKIQARIKQTTQKQKQNSQQQIFIIDIPGQIQVFTWSASSIILIQSISTLMPVKILYIVDSYRCQNPNIFLSNLLFAESIKYRFPKYQFFLALNKCDTADSDLLLKWIKDYEVFMQALQQDSSYLSTLSRSIVLHLSEFYDKLGCVKVSAKTGHGMGKGGDLEKLIFSD